VTLQVAVDSPSAPTSSANVMDDRPTLFSLSDVSSMIEQLSPMPKCSSVRTRKRKAEASVMLTSSPYKNELAAKQKKKVVKQPKPSTSTVQKAPLKKKLTCREDKSRQRINLPAPPKCRKVVEPKGSSNRGSGRRSKGKSTASEAARSKSSKDDVYCKFCDELYVDPPSEDWVQCPKCQRWYHELCGDPDLAHCGQC
jgi:hypothetical protein